MSANKRLEPLTDAEVDNIRGGLDAVDSWTTGTVAFLIATIDARDARIAAVREETLAAAADYVERENYYASNELIVRTIRGLDGDLGRPLQAEIDRLRARLAEVERERDEARASVAECARVWEETTGVTLEKELAHLRGDGPDPFHEECRAKLASSEARADEAGRILGEVCVAGTLGFGERLIGPSDHAAVAAITGVIVQRDEAEEASIHLRAEWAEAKRCFLECAVAAGVYYAADGVDTAPGPVEEVTDAIREAVRGWSTERELKEAAEARAELLEKPLRVVADFLALRSSTSPEDSALWNHWKLSIDALAALDAAAPHEPAKAREDRLRSLGYEPVEPSDVPGMVRGAPDPAKGEGEE